MIKKIKLIPFVALVLMLSALADYECRADDTCMFSVTADDVPPNIVILLDNGAEMQQVVWHSDYDNRLDYTPVPTGPAVSNGSDDDGDGTVDEADEDDVVKTGGSGSGFFNPNGYGVVDHGGLYYLVAACIIWWPLKTIWSLTTMITASRPTAVMLGR